MNCKPQLDEFVVEEQCENCCLAAWFGAEDNLSDMWDDEKLLQCVCGLEPLEVGKFDEVPVNV